MDLFVIVPLMVAGYECIDAIKEEAPGTKLEALRSTLILVAKGIYCQRQNHHLAAALFRVIRGRMRREEVDLLRSSMILEDEEVDDKHDLGQPVRSHWPVSVVKKKEDIDSHILMNLVASLSVEEQLNATSSSEGSP